MTCRCFALTFLRASLSFAAEDFCTVKDFLPLCQRTDQKHAVWKNCWQSEVPFGRRTPHVVKWYQGVCCRTRNNHKNEEKGLVSVWPTSLRCSTATCKWINVLWDSGKDKEKCTILFIVCGLNFLHILFYFIFLSYRLRI